MIIDKIYLKFLIHNNYKYRLKKDKLSIDI